MSLAAPWHLPAAPVINSVTPGRPAHAATINWHPGTTTGGLANTYTYEVSADGGPFVAGTGPIPASPTIATVDCNAVTICSYRLTATNGLGASPVSNTVSTGFNAPTATRTVTSRVSNLNLGSGVPTVAVSWLAPVSLGGAPIIRYEGRRCDGNCDESNAAWASGAGRGARYHRHLVHHLCRRSRHLLVRGAGRQRHRPRAVGKLDRASRRSRRPT